MTTNIHPWLAVTVTLAASVAFVACGSDTTDAPTDLNPTSKSHANVDCAENDGGQLCIISATITADLTVAAEPETTWMISGPVFVGDDTGSTTITFEPGVTVFADVTSSETLFLAIRRNSRIIADGRVDAPIVFTPSTAAGERERGSWGGLIINGNAPLNSGPEAEGEGNTGKYGGSDPEDDSGVLRYVRVEFAGDIITSDDELNGIAFQGVGSGTTVEHVQVHMNSDDGIEFFGGTVDAKYLVLTGIGDDSLDWTDGWRGRIQFALVQQYDDKADRGIEADNNGKNNDATPRSMPVLSNLTLIGGGTGDTGILLRRGTGAAIYNTIIVDFGDSCLDLDDAATFSQAWDGANGTLNGNLVIENSIIHGCNTLYDEDDANDDDVDEPFSVEGWFGAASTNQHADPLLVNPHAIDFDARPAADSPALARATQPASDGFFEEADFIGAMGSEDWTVGWTIRTDR